MPDSELLGKVLAGHRIVRVVGRGGMSIVYAAYEEDLQRTVAFKVLSPEMALDASARQRFERESIAATRIGHPNIIPVYRRGEVDGTMYVTMLLVEGPDLATVLREGPLDPARTMQILSQVAGALDAAHRNGVVHRDVKPGNILLALGLGPDATDHVYVSDFGLAKRLESRTVLTKAGMFMGTPDYSAPEQAEGRGEVDFRVDNYALACVLYQCLTGEVPYPRDSDLAVLLAQLHDPPPKVTDRRPDLPAAVDAVIARGMAKDKAARFPTCRDLVMAAEAALAATTAGSTDGPPREEVEANAPGTDSDDASPPQPERGQTSGVGDETEASAEPSLPETKSLPDPLRHESTVVAQPPRLPVPSPQGTPGAGQPDRPGRVQEAPAIARQAVAAPGRTAVRVGLGFALAGSVLALFASFTPRILDPEAPIVFFLTDHRVGPVAWMALVSAVLAVIAGLFAISGLRHPDRSPRPLVGAGIGIAGGVIVVGNALGVSSLIDVFGGHGKVLEFFGIVGVIGGGLLALGGLVVLIAGWRSPEDS